MILPFARRARRILPLLALLAAGLASPVSAQAPLGEVVEASSPSVVHVAVRFDPAGSDDPVRVQRSSSGFVVGSSGLVLTNAHLVEEVEDDAWDGEFWVEVVTQDGEDHPAKVVARDERTDLALLQLDLADDFVLPALPILSGDAPATGARTVTLSYPDGEHLYAFRGAAARAAEPVTVRKDRLDPEEVLITDTRFHRMLDGGPLIDAHGRVVGVYNASHVWVPRKNDDEEEEEPEVDYAVMVSAAAMRASFADRLEAFDGAAPQLPGVQPEIAVDAIAAIAPAVVSVWTGEEEPHPTSHSSRDPHGNRSPGQLGSGVIVSGSGLVATSSDILRGSPEHELSVRLADGRTFSATLLDKSSLKQLALLKLDVPRGETIPVATIGDSRGTRSGEFIAVVGRPLGPVVTLSIGVLGNTDRGKGYFQIASWVHRGHWGGAVVDNAGRLLAIAVDRASGEEDVGEESYLGFAAPMHRVAEWFDDEWEEHASDAAKAAVTATDDAQLASRETEVTAVVDATESSLINIKVSQAEKDEEDDSGVFDPFAEDDDDGETSWELLGQGSGVVIDRGGLALSNWHVVDAAVDGSGEELEGYKVEVTLPDGREFTARVLSTSRDDDLALLQLELPPGETVVPVELGVSADLYLGQPVVAIGNSLGLSDSVSSGIVSCTSIDVMISGRLREYAGMVMTDAAINPGNSGGALLDLQGRLVGINSAGRTGAGMAIPVDRVQVVFGDKLLSAQRLRSVYVGCKVDDTRDGLLVTDVDRRGPAARAGVQKGDLIQQFRGEIVPNAITWAQLRMGAPAGQAAELVVERDGAPLALEVVPLSHAIWTIQRESGLEVEELSAAEHPEEVRAASLALHRAYTGIPDAEPASQFGGLLRIVRTYPLGDRDVHAQAGDYLLGVTRLVYDEVQPSRELVKLDSVERLGTVLDPLATRDGQEIELWVMRDGEILTIPAFVQRAPR